MESIFTVTSGSGFVAETFATAVVVFFFFFSCRETQPTRAGGLSKTAKAFAASIWDTLLPFAISADSANTSRDDAHEIQRLFNSMSLSLSPQLNL